MVKKEGIEMAYFIGAQPSERSGLRSADGRVLGRVRREVRPSNPQANVKDYRFFVEPLSPLPPEYEEARQFGFTGFLSRLGYGYNAFETDEEALAELEKTLGNVFVTFVPCLKNNRYFVLDDLKMEGKTPAMDRDTGYVPLPVFGTAEAPVFEGNISKFAYHILMGKPLPGLSKKTWNDGILPQMVVAAAKSDRGRLYYIAFSPLKGEPFAPIVIDEGGVYFHLPEGDSLGYNVVATEDPAIADHVLFCQESPLWFVPEGSMGSLKEALVPIPADMDFLSILNHLDDSHDLTDGKKEADAEHLPLLSSPAALSDDGHGDSAEAEPVTPKAEPFTEEDFINRLFETARQEGYLYEDRDLLNFHIAAKAARLVILSGASGIGKSALIRLYGRALGLPKEQVAILPVRPSWMDDADILGYVDMKNMIYRPADTGLCELLLAAKAHPEKLFILCFDEMNLARAEHYFAQFISVLEQEDTPKIRLYNPAMAGRIYNSGLYPPEITIGRNVIFTGTVNVDESTYHFSDKILDRADVITLHQGRFKDMAKSSAKTHGDWDEVTSAVYASFRKEGELSLSEEELDFLDGMNDLFSESGLSCRIGFRAARQMDRYLKNIPDGQGITRKEGFDCQVVQRILTKLRGSSGQMAALLSLSDKGEMEGKLLDLLNAYESVSSFEEARRALLFKARELKLYDYTI